MFYSKTQGSISNELYCPFSATHTFSERLPCVEKVQKTGNNTNFGILLLLFESQFCLSLLCGMTSLSLFRHLKNGDRKASALIPCGSLVRQYRLSVEPGLYLALRKQQLPQCVLYACSIFQSGLPHFKCPVSTHTIPKV